MFRSIQSRRRAKEQRQAADARAPQACISPLQLTNDGATKSPPRLEWPEHAPARENGMNTPRTAQPGRASAATSFCGQ